MQLTNQQNVKAQLPRILGSGNQYWGLKFGRKSPNWWKHIFIQMKRESYQFDSREQRKKEKENRIDNRLWQLHEHLV